MAPVIKLLKQDGNFDVFVCVLRQHKEVPKILSLFDIFLSLYIT